MKRHNFLVQCVPSKTLLVSVIVLAAFWIGTLARQHPVANAEVRPGTPQQAFKSGATRSLVILREISVTLKTIDVRLKRIEAVAMSANEK